MKVICTLCGKTDVTCEAMINPNTKTFANYTDESFSYGWCNNCATGVSLADVEESKSFIQEQYKKFCQSHEHKPSILVCDLVTHQDDRMYNVKIGIGEFPDGTNADDLYFRCKDMDELITLCDFSDKGFTITECYEFH